LKQSLSAYDCCYRWAGFIGYSGNTLLEDHVKELLNRLGGPLGGAPIKTLITTEDQTTLLLDIIGQENVIDASQFSGLNGFIPFTEFGEKQG